MAVGWLLGEVCSVQGELCHPLVSQFRFEAERVFMITSKDTCFLLYSNRKNDHNEWIQKPLSHNFHFQSETIMTASHLVIFMQMQNI